MSAVEPQLTELYAELHGELHRIATSFLRNERSTHTLQPSALINEAFLRMVAHKSMPALDRRFFLRLAARAMRQILIDYSRKHRAAKRDRQFLFPETSTGQIAPLSPEDYIDIDNALQKLERLDTRQSDIVELRFFAGLSVPETAEVLGVSEKTVKRDWEMARAWLLGELEGE
jgi:RNA polymerase sigma-70 factor, ECF subfamily